MNGKIRLRFPVEKDPMPGCPQRQIFPDFAPDLVHFGSGQILPRTVQETVQTGKK
jgi:hypothetical protein